MRNIRLPNYIRSVFIGLNIIMLVYFMVIGKQLIVPLMVGGYIAMLMVPFCDRLESIKIPRIISALFAVMVVTGFLALIFYFFFIQIKSFSEDFGNWEGKLNSTFTSFNRYTINNFDVNFGLRTDIEQEEIMEFLKGDNNTIAEALAKTLGDISTGILVPVFLFLFLIYRDHLKRFIIRIFSTRAEDDICEFLISLRTVIQDYLIGMSKVILILAILNVTALFFLDIEHAVFFGVFAAFLNIIPYIGPLIAAILPMFFALVTKDTLWYPVGVAASFTIIQFVEGNFLTPKIVGSNVSLNAFVTLVALLVGGFIWGVIGMILIIPTVAILKKLFELSPHSQPYAFLLSDDDGALKSD